MNATRRQTWTNCASAASRPRTAHDTSAGSFAAVARGLERVPDGHHVAPLRGLRGDVRG